MTREKGRPRKGRLADMAIYPTGECADYTPPPNCECEEFSTRHDLSLGHRMGTRQVYLKNRSSLVYFSVWQSILVDNKWQEVARIDCSHGTVHRHQFTRSGGNQTQTLELIPAHDPWGFIGRWYDDADLIMQNEWKENVRRWLGDGQ